MLCRAAARPAPALRALVGGLLLVSFAALGMRCPLLAPDPDTGVALFVSPQSNPIALSRDGAHLYVANTTAGSLSIFDVSDPERLREIAEVKVGLDPVGVAVRPKVDPSDPNEDELVFVTNHLSDSISVVSLRRRAVVQTIQGLVHADGLSTPDDLVSTTDEPVGIVFDGPSRAFVTLDVADEVVVLNVDANGRTTLDPRRLPIAAQAPRALAAANGQLYVAAFESGNQTELPTCAPGDNRGLDESDPVEQGCEFHLSFNFLLSFATQPNLGGRVIRDGDQPDRDLFVFDTQTLALTEVVEGVGTLLYGVATHGDSVYVTHADARNDLDGLAALGNRMFENRITGLDCAGGCTPLGSVDLDAAAAALGMAVPTPYGVAVSDDGETLVVTAAGSDGKAPDHPGTPPDQPELPGLVTLDAAGNVLGGVRLGAIPQGVALDSGPDGGARIAYVLNTVDSTVSVVDVSDPAAPVVLGTLFSGSDPTPEAVRRGRIAFSTARASTSGNFSCESCHPNGNMDQLIWTINTVNGPDDPPDPNGAEAEPRTTMPIRGLRDTLPLHWDGSLADPLPVAFVPGDAAPDCSLEDGELACIRQLVDASLTGVMCRQVPDCPPGIGLDPAAASLAGALSEGERDDMAAFLAAVSFPPSPKRRPSDALSATAREGMRDFFTDDDGAGLANLIPSTRTCGDRAAGCHALPLTVSTNSATVGRFDAPSIRGMWDRFILFSNGMVSSEEGLALAESCASGSRTDAACDPTGLGLFPPSGETVWDPALGMTERGSFMASFEGLFQVVYGVPGARIWEFINEMSVGLPGLLGRQVTLEAGSASDPDVSARVAQLVQAARDGKILAEAHVGVLRTELYYDPATGTWRHPERERMRYSTDELEVLAALGPPVTLTAHLPKPVQPGADERQPLLAPNVVESTGSEPELPRVAAGSAELSAVLWSRYVRFPAEGPGPKVLVDGAVCEACSIESRPGDAFDGGDAVAVTITLLPGPGAHTLQVLNPEGLASNELPFFVD